MHCIQRIHALEFWRTASPWLMLHCCALSLRFAYVKECLSLIKHSITSCNRSIDKVVSGCRSAGGKGGWCNCLGTGHFTVSMTN
jgi:hypothetical protein